MQQEDVVGVMMTPVEEPGPEFKTTVDMAVKIVERVLDQRVPDLKIEILNLLAPIFRRPAVDTLRWTCSSLA